MSGELVYRVLGNRKCLQVLSFQFLCNKISFLHVHIFLYMSYIVFFFICHTLYFSLCALHCIFLYASYIVFFFIRLTFLYTFQSFHVEVLHISVKCVEL